MRGMWGPRLFVALAVLCVIIGGLASRCDFHLENCKVGPGWSTDCE